MNGETELNMSASIISTFDCECAGTGSLVAPATRTSLNNGLQPGIVSKTNPFPP